MVIFVHTNSIDIQGVSVLIVVLLSQVLLEVWACMETSACNLMKYHHSVTHQMKTLKMNKNGLRNQYLNGQGIVSPPKDAQFPSVKSGST